VLTSLYRNNQYRKAHFVGRRLVKALKHKQDQQSAGMLSDSVFLLGFMYATSGRVIRNSYSKGIKLLVWFFRHVEKDRLQRPTLVRYARILIVLYSLSQTSKNKGKALEAIKKHIPPDEQAKYIEALNSNSLTSDYLL